MSAKDYKIVISWTQTPYLAKVLKNGEEMGSDRRIIEYNEIIGLFENYLQKWTEKHPGETLVISKDGKPIFEAKLLK